MPGVALFVQFTLEPSGSPISGLMAVEALREAGFRGRVPMLLERTLPIVWML